MNKDELEAQIERAVNAGVEQDRLARMGVLPEDLPHDPNPDYMRELQDAFDNHTAPTTEPLEFDALRDDYFRNHPEG